MDKVSDFIINNWKNTIKPSTKDIPYPYTSPSISKQYTDFYYWDIYFINKGLLLSSTDEQVRNNLNNINYYINKYGYMPNSNKLLNRSQPPVFPMCVYDLYKYSKDINDIKRYIDSVIKEHDFFMKYRITKYGLNQYGCNINNESSLLNEYEILKDRVQEYGKNKKEKLHIAKNILAIAESGLDFNMRFKTKESKIAADEFIHLDLNCILYYDEILIAKMLKLLSRNKESKEYLDIAKNRKKLINKYCFNKKENIYLDYNFKTNSFSSIVTAVSLYPFTFNISKNKDSILKVLSKLEFKNGISSAEYRKDTIYYQWDYPVLWGEVTFFAYIALKNLKLYKDAKRIKDKYIKLIDKQFNKTGELWEKYNAKTGEIINNEYIAPPFMGWTASTYQYFKNENDILK